MSLSATWKNNEFEKGIVACRGLTLVNVHSSYKSLEDKDAVLFIEHLLPAWGCGMCCHINVNPPRFKTLIKVLIHLKNYSHSEVTWIRETAMTCQYPVTQP